MRRATSCALAAALAGGLATGCVASQPGVPSGQGRAADSGAGGGWVRVEDGAEAAAPSESGESTGSSLVDVLLDALWYALLFGPHLLWR